MTYFYLGLAVLFEAAWAIALKASDGFTRPLPSAIVAVAYVLSVVFLAFATRRMDLGTAYAIWAGLGVTLIAGAGVVWFKEPVGVVKVGSVALIVIGVVGLNLAGRRG